MQVCNPCSTAEQLNEARKDLVERIGAGIQSQKGNANDGWCPSKPFDEVELTSAVLLKQPSFWLVHFAA